MSIRRLLSRLADVMLGPKCNHGYRGSCPSCWMDEALAKHGETIEQIIDNVAMTANLVASIYATVSRIERSK